MAFGPYGKIDWPAACDPEWSDYMGVCSDENGTPIKADGTKATYFEVISEITRTPQAPPAQRTVARPEAAAFDPARWLKTGYNAVYAAVAFVMLLMLMGAVKGGRR